MANYLLTGAAGFIGSRVAEFLLNSSHNVTGLDNMNDAYDVRMKNYRLGRLINQPGFTFHQIDISDRTILAEDIFVRREKDPARSTLEPAFDAVINLAARAGVRQAVIDPWVYMETNLTGTLNLLELCRRMDIPKFILASTSSVYGEEAPLPTPESADSDHPMQQYAASKKGAEALCYSYNHLYNLDVTVFRYFTVYGPAGRPDMSMFRFVKWISEGIPLKLYGDGEQTRGFTYLDDIARGTIAGLIPLGYETINLGGHEEISIIDLIRLIEELIGKEAQIVHHPPLAAEMRANWADTNKAGELLGWEPQVDLLTGLRRLIDWYNAERSWAREISTD